ncbi:DMT family transporter [uncultured Jatrophihabitans sp.]|uniref:DMT family transporter n=1 Tax=uncultured Jatrophihabitans sp. TaxID=1610747 RepID=UPI0035CAFBCF
MSDAGLTVSAGLALASALAFAVATVAQQRAASRSSDEDARNASFIVSLLRSPLWWAGTLGNGGGYVLQAFALAFGPLLLVSPIVVTSLLFALPLSARLMGRRLTAATWTWAVVLAGSLGVFVALGNPDKGRDRGTGTGWLLVVLVCLPVVLACLVIARRRTGAARAGSLAVADGVLAGVNSVLTKSTVLLLGHGLATAFTSGETYGVIVVGLSGVYLQQLAFQAGELQASMPVIAVLEPAVGALLGVTLLDERLQAGPAVVVVLLVVSVIMAVATVALARSHAQAHDEVAVADAPSGAPQVDTPTDVVARLTD